MDGQRTTAVILTARPKDSTQRIMVFLPYTPRTASSPTVWREPRIDFPEESAGHLMPKQNLVLSELLKGRDSGALPDLFAACEAPLKCWRSSISA
jgi:hypothetical protein